MTSPWSDAMKEAAITMSGGPEKYAALQESLRKRELLMAKIGRKQKRRQYVLYVLLGMFGMFIFIAAGSASYILLTYALQIAYR